MATKRIGLPGDSEEMAVFFDLRADEYEQHMAETVEDFDAFYRSVADSFPAAWSVPRILDLGIGTGLELDRLFARFPEARVTGIDVSHRMLDRLAGKPQPWVRQVRTICGSFFDVDFGEAIYDGAVSVMALHHWTPDVKRALYRRIRRALVPSGIFVNADYIDNEEDSARRLAEHVAEGYAGRHTLHIDLPLSREAELALLCEAGFPSVRIAFERSLCSTFVARKPEAASDRVD